jgi:hypothetical protein
MEIFVPLSKMLKIEFRIIHLCSDYSAENYPEKSLFLEKQV